MFVQIETTPNPNSLKFLPGKIVSNNGSFEINDKKISHILNFYMVDDNKFKKIF